MLQVGPPSGGVILILCDFLNIKIYYIIVRGVFYTNVDCVCAT
jgi:hypothetical protein